MEKRKLIPLSMMLLCSVCFGACKNPSSETTNVIATVNGREILADDIYNEALYSQATAEYIYGVLEKALIESAIPITNAMKTKVESEVKNWQDEIKENAQLNGTDYEDDLKTALEEQGVSSVEELINSKIYDLQLQYAKEKFLDAKGEDYKKDYIDSNYLYHVGDINLSISSTSSSHSGLYGLTITSTEAENIYNAFKELVENEPYYSIAGAYSSTDKDGDLGIVTLNDTDITNELRYALIGYSSIVEGKYSEFNLPTNEHSMELTNMYAAGMQTIPYSYIASLNELDPAKTEKDTKYYESDTRFYYSGGGDSVSSSSKVYYRNILFNSLLNTRAPKFITVSDSDVEAGARAVKMQVLAPNVETQGYATTTSEQNVLVNEAGNPYVVFKDSKGLHILSINKTPFSENLYDYYSGEVDESDNSITYAEMGSDRETRLDEVNAMAEKYIRREYGENTGNDKLLSFAMFNYYLSQTNGEFKIIDEKVKSMITQYMTSESENVDSQIKSAYDGYYDTYSNLIWFTRQPEIMRETPILACLSKNSEDGKYGCIYDYGNGFTVYAPSSESEDE